MTRQSGCASIDRARRFVDARHEFRQSRENGHQAHHGDVGERKQRGKPLARHRLAADAAQTEVDGRAVRSARISAAPSAIAGRFSGDEKDARLRSRRIGARARRAKRTLRGRAQKFH